MSRRHIDRLDHDEVAVDDLERLGDFTISPFVRWSTEPSVVRLILMT
jgi:hypothetical protein